MREKVNYYEILINYIDRLLKVCKEKQDSIELNNIKKELVLLKKVCSTLIFINKNRYLELLREIKSINDRLVLLDNNLTKK